jgi:hypothetical protein
MICKKEFSTMPRQSKERECVDRLYEVLRSHQQVINVSTDVRAGCSEILRSKWDKLTGKSSLRLQPQIDILLEAEYPPAPDGIVFCGIEVKYFDKKLDTLRFNLPFYAGLDEAIGSLSYGLDSSALWHVFAQSTSKEDLIRYGLPFWRHIRKFNLPIEFSVMRVNGENFDVYISSGEPLKTKKLSDLTLTFKYPNPIKNEAFQLEFRRILYDWWKKKLIKQQQLIS